MLTKRIHNGIAWIDLESPSKDEVRQVMAEYSLHPLIANELLAPSLRDRVDAFPGYLYVILHFPSIVHSHGGRDQEVDFVIGKDFFLTAHYHQIDSITEFAKLYEIDEMLGKGGIERHGGLVFYHLLRKLYETLGREVDGIETELESIEKRIFAGEESLLVRDISDVEHKLLDFRHVTRPHGPIFDSLEFESASKNFFGKDASHYVRSLSGEYKKIQAILDNSQEMIQSLRDTNDSLLSTKTNDIIKRLTIMSFMILPMTLIVSIFGMNSEHTPIVGLPNDFWIIMGLLAISFVSVFVYFKRRGWI